MLNEVQNERKLELMAYEDVGPVVAESMEVMNCAAEMREQIDRSFVMVDEIEENVPVASIGTIIKPTGQI